eukprot:3440967-Rhodomonas_salina.2
MVGVPANIRWQHSGQDFSGLFSNFKLQAANFARQPCSDFSESAKIKPDFSASASLRPPPSTPAPVPPPPASRTPHVSTTPTCEEPHNAR